MKQYFLLFCFLLLLACSVPVAEHPDLLPDEETREVLKSGLYQIEIERFGELRFQGLIAIRKGRELFDYVLIDATGVTLLEGRSQSEARGRGELKGMLKRSRLAEILTVGLSRMFMLLPESQPCGRNGILTFCVKRPSMQHVVKEVRFGPILCWDVEYSVNSKEKTVAKEISKEVVLYGSYTYRQPWLGLKIRLVEQKTKR